MNSQRKRSQVLTGSTGSPSKKLKRNPNSYFQITLKESGLITNCPPDKSIINQETIHTIRYLKKNLEKHIDYPRNVTEFISNLEKECQDLDVFKFYLFPNIIRRVEDSPEDHHISDSLFKILLSVPILQNKLMAYIFKKAVDLAAESKCGPWIQMILKCFSSLDCITDTDKMSLHLIDLLDIATEKNVRLEIITAIPDIVGDQEHNNIASELSRILSEDQDLIPAILECLSYLCLSDEQHEQLQKKTLNILMSLTKCEYFPNFIKFLLMPGRMSDSAYYEAVQGIRNSLNWPSSLAKPQEIATSQVLTAAAIRNSMLYSKVTANAWLKIINSCKTSTDHKPIDFIILLIFYSISDEKQRQVENLIKKQIKLDILKEDLLEECFDKFVPILKDNLKNLINLTNSLLKTKADAVVETFAARLYMLMFSKLEDSCQTIVAELLQLGLDCQQAVLSILLILNNVASKDMSLLKPQSVQMLSLLDRMDNMSLNEIRAVMNLLCGLAYSYENSVIRDDIHMIIRKELGSSIPKIKIQGILAGLHAVKFLMSTNHDDDQTADFPDDVSYSSVTFLAEGALREAAQIIELISRSTRQFPDMIAFFYDELTTIIESASVINKNFLSWLTDAVTNDLQQNFIVDNIEVERVGDIKLSMQYCINADSEMDETIAINIAGLTLQPKIAVNIGILSPLFQLVQTLHSRQHNGTLSTIDALLGCPVIMPQFDVDLVEDMDNTTINNILDCIIHCENWFRELLNAFSTQDDDALKAKILKRLMQVEDLETLTAEVLLKTKIAYKPPNCIFNISKYIGEHAEKKQNVKVPNTKSKAQKKTAQDDTVLPETARSQATQNNNTVKNKLNVICNLPLRQLNLNLLHLLNNDLGDENEEASNLTIKSLTFLLKCTNSKLESVLLSKIKRKTFLSKPEENIYDPKKAEDCATSVSKVLPKMVDHLTIVTSYLDSHTNTQNESGFIFTSEILDYITCLEYIYNMFTIYLKWIGFRSHHNALLKTSLRTLASIDGNANLVSLKDLLLATAKNFQKHEKYCMLLSTAMSLIELIKTIQEYSDNRVILIILRDMAQNFLSIQWKTSDGIPEKGLVFNQSVDKLAELYFTNNEILALKNLTLQLADEIKYLKSRNDTLPTFKCVTKGNFPVLYRNLGSAVYESTKSRLNKGLTNSEHLGLWKDVAIILKNMSDICKVLENRNNLSAFFKKSVPVLKLFLSQGIPILEIQLKNDTEEVLEILKILQQSTRFLQSLCCHSRLKKDKVLMSKVPGIRQLLETLIYKVKAALAANKCSEAFWMGNLKNKDIHGEIIATQQSIESEESVEDNDEQLPDDDDSDDSDDEMINPDSKSMSDIV
ncbi:Fanconi anemia group D2 protein [Ostrinia nubilalis]|uniref:Fanconi anemia group D2 protein n=1 Tax=Ostrinia nubilalis TaxID=29057 RepID=UPI0030825AA1